MGGKTIENIKTVNKAGGGANIATRAFTLGKNPTVAEPATTYGKSSLSNNADEVNDNVGEGTDFDINESPFEGFFQRAWHGSPHRFEKFDLGAIGTGEGKQAHGWGLYFADDREVAENYRDVLSEDVSNAVPSLYEVEAPPIDDMLRFRGAQFWWVVKLCYRTALLSRQNVAMVPVSTGKILVKLCCSLLRILCYGYII